MEESSSVGFYPGSFVFMPHLNQAGPFCCKRWAENKGPDTKSVLNLGDLGAEPRVQLSPAAWAGRLAQLGLREQMLCLGAPGWAMGVCPRSGTQGQKFIMKNPFRVVGKSVA